MRFSDIPTNPDSRMLRQFAALWLLIFGAIGCYQVLNGGTIWAWILITAAMGIGIPGVAFPQLMKPIFVTWMILAFPIGWLISRVILLFVFCFAFLPIGLLLRAMGHDPLRLKRPTVSSYWLPKEQQQDQRRYLRQY